jgi:hypothetical protein
VSRKSPDSEARLLSFEGEGERVVKKDTLFRFIRGRVVPCSVEAYI